MIRSTSHPVWLGLSVLLVGLASCSSITTVQDVQKRPNRGWFGSTVQLQGRVGDRIPLVKAQVYELQDSTGKIWVLATDRSLKTGDQVKIQGKIRIEPLPITDPEAREVYIEQQQLILKEPP